MQSKDLDRSHMRGSQTIMPEAADDPNRPGARITQMEEPRAKTIRDIVLWANEKNLREAIKLLSDDCYRAAFEAGWHSDLITGEMKVHNIGEKLMLIVSEIAEAMEGHRKDLMDDHITHRKMIEVELVDGLIRILDLGQYMGLDLAGAYIDKRKYNDVRPDHKREARLAVNGKKY